MTHFHKTHVMCAVCGKEENNYYSLGAEFTIKEDHTVQSVFTVLPRHQGYFGLLHGGIASSLLDAAMTHCLLSQQITALTAQLDVRYHHPIKVGDQINIIGELLTVKRGIYFLKAYLNVGQETRVSANGKFIASKLAEID
ncbi:PaaI family thioesterase [Vibrio sp. Y2-5]|uniref:PaaI family thioesterase n=1 Tax=Vibrio TaxID=662 RepID=UPI00142DF253|nr:MULTISPECIES: PaaI family thioesterase [Vibrio]MBD0786354.1 PaaI family thioesterase [Vibrio sp. Y2-5]NIY92222.1 PaaI family thioesterase [Vibrio diazotrophicus]